MKTLIFVTVGSLASFLGLSNAWAGGPGSQVQVISPSSYAFTLQATQGPALDCSTLNQQLSQFQLYNCNASSPSIACRMLMSSIKREVTVDIDNGDNHGQFDHFYAINSYQNAARATSVSNRFDVAYADSYTLNISDLAKPDAFKFDGNFSSSEVALQEALNLPTDFSIQSVNGERVLKVSSKLIACALEAKRVSLLGRADVSVRSYQPNETAMYSVVSEVYQKAVELSARKDLSPSQKEYLLGLHAGQTFKDLNYPAGASSDLDAIAVSLRNVLLDTTSSSFTPFSVATSDPGFAVSLFEPGYVAPSAVITLSFSGATQ